MATKIITFRIPEEMVDYITPKEGNVNGGLRDALSTLIQIQTISSQEIKGVFTPDEWKFLAESGTKTLMTEAFLTSKSALIARNEESALFDHLDAKHHIDVAELNGKIDCMYGAHIEAIYRRIKAYWDNPDTDADKWANY